MSLRNALVGLVVGVAGFLAIGVAVTELASGAIEFSAIVGIPVGAVAGVLLGTLTYLLLGAADPVRRRRGTALAVAGTAFLAVTFSLIAVGVRNSLALPVAAVAAVAAAAVTLAYRRSTDEGTPTEPS